MNKYHYIVVKHKTSDDWFRVTDITISMDYKIYARVDHQATGKPLIFTDEELINALELVKMDFKRSKGYTVKSIQVL